MPNKETVFNLDDLGMMIYLPFRISSINVQTDTVPQYRLDLMDDSSQSIYVSTTYIIHNGYKRDENFRLTPY